MQAILQQVVVGLGGELVVLEVGHAVDSEVLIVMKIFVAGRDADRWWRYHVSST